MRDVRAVWATSTGFCDVRWAGVNRPWSSSPHHQGTPAQKYSFCSGLCLVRRRSHTRRVGHTCCVDTTHKSCLRNAFEGHRLARAERQRNAITRLRGSGAKVSASLTADVNQSTQKRNQRWCWRSLLLYGSRWRNFQTFLPCARVV